ncbi:MAG: VWA domain-containing protein [Candidatus Hydrogenedentes bacterium]|nr:VWA domain-containing protein [Candidatus Hydrogenedentota bacterium]
MVFHSRCKHRILVALAALACAAHGQEPQIEASLGTPVMLAGGGTAYLRVAMTGQEIKDEKSRAPLNVSIVIDRSGSMQGEKIESAKRAAKAAIERLRPNDIVSVIAYETTVNIVQGATRIDSELGKASAMREQIFSAIDQITSGGSTALFAGVSMGAGELRKDLRSGYVNRLVLLSDGIANIGPSSPGELAELGGSLAKEGISVTTLGLGLDYNEDLMSKLASSSDGNHMFIENVNDLDRAYAMEFGDAMTVVARDATVIVRCANGVRPVRALGREAIVNGQTVRMDLGQIGSARTKYCLLEVEVPAGVDGQSLQIADVDISYLNIASGTTSNATKPVSVRYTNSAKDVDGNINKPVMVAAVQQIAADRNILAMRLRDSGNVAAACDALLSNEAFLNENYDRFKDEQLRKDAMTNGFAAENLDPENWKFNRKLQQEYQVGTKNQSAILEKTR